MLCILSSSTDPYFNLAAEEYYFKYFNEDIFFLYVNSPAVVVGKHQNAIAEINPQFVAENKIQVVRRLSGGGAVYHDLGNLNFSFHQRVEDTAKISFKLFNDPIIEVLNQLGVHAKISKRNDIFVDDFKVSGHAEHVFRNRILSHGTLLFDAQKENLSLALKNQSGSFSGKAIQSVRSKVANIVDFLEQAISLDEFIQAVQQHILATNFNCKTYTISESNKKAIRKLVKEKYATWEWNFGYSPKYKFEKKQTFENGTIAVSIFVEKGIMKELEIKGIENINIEAVRNKLINSLHQKQSINQLLTTLGIQDRYKSILLDCFF